MDALVRLDCGCATTGPLAITCPQHTLNARWCASYRPPAGGLTAPQRAKLLAELSDLARAAEKGW